MSTEHTMSQNDDLPQHEPLQQPQQTLVHNKELAPIKSRNRIELMDILRGFALIGIAMMNIEWFNRSFIELGQFDHSLTGTDWSAGWMIRLLVEGKFYKLFSLLFGMGFAVMLIRAQEAGRPFYAWFSRRMIFLFLFGMAHMIFLWGGDILHDYAVGGLLVLVWVWAIHYFKRMVIFQQTRWFLRIGLGMLALPFLIAIGAGIFFGNTRTQEVMDHDQQQRITMKARAKAIKSDTLLAQQLLAAEAERKANDKPKVEVDEETMSDEEKIEFDAKERFLRLHARDEDKQAELTALTQDSYWSATVYRAKSAFKELENTPFFATVICFPLFLVGYWFVASGVVRRPQEHIRLFKAMTWLGLGVGGFISIAALLIGVHPASKNGIEIMVVSGVLFMAGQYLMTAGYLGGFALMAMTVRGKNWLSWLAPMGKMALTNYITHSIILSSIFFGYAGGMYGQISRAPQVAIVLAIIAVQAVLCTLWLKHFRFGPLEWLWRSLTYLKWQPMKLEKVKAEPSDAASTV